MSPKTFHLSVKLMADDRRGRYLVLRRSMKSKHFKGKWELPGGKVDAGEDFSAALLREVKEETGLTVELERVAGSGNSVVEGRSIAYVFMEGHFDSTSVRLSSEHVAAEWLTLDKVLELGDALCPQFEEFVTNFCRSRGFERKREEKSTVPERVSVAWLDGQVKRFLEVRRRYEILAQKLQLILQKAMADLCPLALVEGRAKGVASFADKIVRKNKYKDPLTELTDLCGVRVVTHLKSEVDAVCAFIRENFLIDEKNSLDTLSRLQPAEFGYRSVHYVVQFKPGRFEEVPADLRDLKAEIQVRTILQHAWSDIGHDRLYKGRFKVPGAWAREAARIAAVLESADESFGRMVQGLESYRSNYGAYLSPEQVNEEAEIAETIRQNVQEDAALVERVARLALSQEDWSKARRVVEGFSGVRTTRLKYCLGTALSRQHKDAPRSAAFRKGRDLLLQAAAQDPADTECRVRLAEIATTPEERLEFLHDAFVADSRDPEALGSYVRQKVLVDRDASFVSLLRPSLEAAIETCRLQVEAGVNIPWAFYRIARFQLLLGREWESIDALAQAIRRTGKNMSSIDAALEEAEALGRVDPDRTDIQSVVRFLCAARHVLGPTKESARRVRALATPDLAPIRGPVTIVAGGCDPTRQGEMEGYRGLLRDAFGHYRGTVISGGTEEGISGLVGELGAGSGGRIHTIGYLPASLPTDDSAHVDRRFHELRRTASRNGFTALEPLQNWIDLLASGIDPAAVRVLGISGGRLSALEYRIAWALGARVAIVQRSGREADKLERDIRAAEFQGLLVLPNDPMTLLAFLSGGETNTLISAEDRERLARLEHAKFLEEGRHKNPDLAMRPWDQLDEGLRHSNLDQVAFMTQILHAAGFEVVPETDPLPVADITPKKELMSQMEHGRWNLERSSKGWRLGRRNPGARTSPYLVSWEDLPEDVKQWDRNVIARFPSRLAEVGLKIVERVDSHPVVQRRARPPVRRRSRRTAAP